MLRDTITPLLTILTLPTLCKLAVGEGFGIFLISLASTSECGVERLHVVRVPGQPTNTIDVYRAAFPEVPVFLFDDGVTADRE